MPGSFQSINLMSTALRAFQNEMSVTGDNISNVDTTGYSRQIATLQEAPPTQVYNAGNMLSLGNGVSTQSVKRVRDMFLQGQRLSVTSDLGKYTTQNDGMSQVQSVLTDSSGTGISSDLDAFWNAWSSLASNPSSSARLTVQTAGQTLANDISGTYANLQTVKTNTSSEINQTLTDIQTAANKISTLNNQIRADSVGGSTPNDLLDQRDQAVQDLAQMVNVNVQTSPGGSDVITIGGFTLVSDQGAATLPTTWDATTGTLTDAKGNSVPITSGNLAGQFSQYNRITTYSSDLDTLANNLRTQVNTAFAAGTNTYGATGLKFFNDVAAGNPQTGAINFDLDSTGVVGPPASAGVKTDANAIASGTTTAASDGSVALGLSQMRSQTVAALGGQTFGTYYSSLVTQIGQDAATATSNMKTQNSIVTQVDNQIQSTSGVNLDEEMSNLLKYQRSYQAAAETLSQFNTVLGDLMNILQ